MKKGENVVLLIQFQSIMEDVQELVLLIQSIKMQQHRMHTYKELMNLFYKCICTYCGNTAGLLKNNIVASAGKRDAEALRVINITLYPPNLSSSVSSVFSVSSTLPALSSQSLSYSKYYYASWPI